MSASEIEARLAPRERELALWSYRRLAETAREAGIEPVALFYALPGDVVDRAKESEFAELRRHLESFRG